VAISTPVPKCLQKKKTFEGILIHLNFFATTGNPQPAIEAKDTMTVQRLVQGRNGENFDLQTAPTCRGKLYSALSALLPHTGFSTTASAILTVNSKRVSFLGKDCRRTVLLICRLPRRRRRIDEELIEWID